MNFKSSLLLVLGSWFVVPASAQYTNILIDDTGNPEETSIYINPKNTQNLVAGANIDFVYHSTDGGATWMKDQLQSTYGVWGDPCIMADTAGDFYFIHLSNPSGGNWIDRIVFQKSVDGGVNWSDGTFTGLNGARAQDKAWVSVDPQTNAIYTTWTQFENYGSSSPFDSSIILFSKSTDAGATWSTPKRLDKHAGDCIDSDNTAEGAVPCVGVNGEVYDAWSNRDTLWFDRSLDGGQTWLDDDIFISTQVGGWDYTIPGLYRANGLPIAKCDLSNSAYHGNIYINWSDQRNGDIDIWVAKSADGGDTWSAPVKVNDDNTGNDQFMSWMDVDPKTGYVYVLFYDRRNYSNQNTDVYLAYSVDGGNTFTNEKISDSPFNPDEGTFFGDYVNVNVYDGKIAPIWTRQDGATTSIYTAQVDFPTLVESAPAIRNEHFILYQNVPNPFSSSTKIEMDITESDYYSLSLYDLTGRKVADIISHEYLRSGHHAFDIDASRYQLGDNTYYYTMSRNNEMVTKKLVIIN